MPLSTKQRKALAVYARRFPRHGPLPAEASAAILRMCADRMCPAGLEARERRGGRRAVRGGEGDGCQDMIIIEGCDDKYVALSHVVMFGIAEEDAPRPASSRWSTSRESRPPSASSRTGPAASENSWSNWTKLEAWGWNADPPRVRGGHVRLAGRRHRRQGAGRSLRMLGTPSSPGGARSPASTKAS